MRGRHASQLSCASGSGSRQSTTGGGLVCGHGPTGAVRTNGSARERERDRPAIVRAEHRAAELGQLGALERLARGSPAAAPRCRRRARSVRPRCDSMYAAAIARVTRRAPMTCSVVRSVPALTIEPSRTLGQLLLAKALDARPERDIRRRRVLRLQRDELRDRLREPRSASARAATAAGAACGSAPRSVTARRRP